MKLTAYPFSEKRLPKRKNQFFSKGKKSARDIKMLDILEMTPLDAMNILYKLHKETKIIM